MGGVQVFRDCFQRLFEEDAQGGFRSWKEVLMKEVHLQSRVEQLYIFFCGHTVHTLVCRDVDQSQFSLCDM